MFDEQQSQSLNAPLDNSRVKSRSKGNITLSYLEGHDIIETANRVFGYGNWSYNVSKLDQVSQEVNQNQNNVVCYKAVVLLSVHDSNHDKNISREDVGFGTGVAKTLADAHEGGAKEAVTDAIKRCFRSFGNQFGNSLYSKDKSTTSNNQQYNNQNYSQTPNNTNQQNYQPQNQPMQNNPVDFTALTNIGLTVMQQGQNLIVVGDNIFANKELIKQHGFNWDAQNKVWYRPMNNQQAA
jgi:DNA repair and recombination protein RAD52